MHLEIKGLYILSYFYDLLDFCERLLIFSQSQHKSRIVKIVFSVLLPPCFVLGVFPKKRFLVFLFFTEW